jgi:hypothetical protein
MKKSIMAAAAVGVMAASLLAAPAQAVWTELTPGRLGFWTYSYGDPYEQGQFGQYRSPDYGGNWGNALQDRIDNPASIDNDTRRPIWVYKNTACRSDGGRWYRKVEPNQRVVQTIGTDWVGIQAYSFLGPTGRQRSCL